MTQQATPHVTPLEQELLAALKAAATRLESGNEVDQACARHCRMAIAKAEQQP